MHVIEKGRKRFFATVVAKPWEGRFAFGGNGRQIDTSIPRGGPVDHIFNFRMEEAIDSRVVFPKNAVEIIRDNLGVGRMVRSHGQAPPSGVGAVTVAQRSAIWLPWNRQRTKPWN